jgi:putative FmdB family regulatory protein
LSDEDRAMPVYDYECTACGPFTVLRPMADYDKPHACPDCGAQAGRAFLVFPSLSAMSRDRRVAFETNERSADSPKRSKKMGLHAPGCACCSSDAAGRKSKTVRTPDGAKTFPSKRPWMISH